LTYYEPGFDPATEDIVILGPEIHALSHRALDEKELEVGAGMVSLPTRHKEPRHPRSYWREI